MEDVLKSDIFFIVTTIVVLIVGVLLVVALARLLAILKNIKSVSKLAKDGASFVTEDLGLIRKDFKDKIKYTNKNIKSIFKKEGIVGLIKTIPIIIFGEQKESRNKSKK